MLDSGVDKIYRDCILGHSLDGMDAHYMAPSEGDLKKAMERYTDWLNFKVNKIESRDQNHDQAEN